MRCLAQLLATAALLLAQVTVMGGGMQNQPPPKPLIDCSNEELLQRVPDLKGVQFDSSPELLRATLNQVGKALDTSTDSFVDVSAKEEIFELRLENGDADVVARHEEFRHVIHLPTDQTESESQARLRETRIAEKAKRVAQAGGAGFFVLSRFVNLLEFLLPDNQALSRFRVVGGMGSGDSESIVLAYAYIPGSKLDSGLVTRAGAAPEAMQGVVWVDSATGLPRRVLVEPLGSLAGSGMDELRTELVIAPVRFDSIQATLLLPVLVTTHAKRASVHTYTVSRLTGYRQFGVDLEGDPESPKQTAGVFPALPATEDAYELLAQGVTLRMERKEAEAIAPLRAALRLNAGLVAARIGLGLALDATGDPGGAEAELREASKQLGGSATVHFALGVVLFHRGSAKEAAAEFRESIRLVPANPTSHVNLALALERQGDVKGAIDELRAAAQLDPENAAVKSMLEQLAKHSTETTQHADEVPKIRVDVRQVVVPVMVLDKDGHHVTGLKQADFRVLEDGAEQMVTAFRVETSGVMTEEAEPKSGAPQAAEQQKAAAAGPAPPAIRHTYLICIDTIHAEFANLHYVREALQMFFKSQPAGDSQYALIGLGQSTTLVQNLTRDPAEALAALDDKAFVKLAQGGRNSNWKTEISRFMAQLNEIRAQVDSPDRVEHELGISRMQMLPSVAESLAGLDRSLTVSLLGGLRAMVAQLTKTSEHRTVLLFSDGFHMSAGREPWELLVAFFPELNRFAMRTQERMTTEFDAIVKVAARSNVIIDTIDSRGLYTPSYLDAANGSISQSAAARVVSLTNSLQFDAGSSLMELASATGGTAYYNTNDILASTQKAVAAGRDYYTLAYVSTNNAMDGKFRAITVEVKGRKLVVKAKRGYWATAD